jgi:hypothetical protein
MVTNLNASPYPLGPGFFKVPIDSLVNATINGQRYPAFESEHSGVRMRPMMIVLWASVIFFVFVGMASAQKIEYDWQSNGSGQPLIWPSNITKTQVVPFVIHNTNNLLYTYRVGGSCTQTNLDPWGTIAPVLKSGATAGDQPPNLTDTQKIAFNACSTDIANANGDWNTVKTQVDLLKNTPAPDGDKTCTSAKPCRISLVATQKRWEENIESVLQSAEADIAKAVGSCSTAPQTASSARALQEQAQGLRKWYSSSHDWTGAVSVIPDSSCTFTITETYLTVDTTPAVTVSFTAGQPRMTVSVGPLFSQIQDRGYSVVTAPPPTGSTTNQTVLQINGISSLSTYLTGHLNFALPLQGDWFNGERGGIAISTGPVLRIGGQSAASAFGWYAGPSYHLYHLIYFTAGMHIGQFADLPGGFSSPGQTVPSGFPTPVARNRTTARFAFGITLKAKDLTTLGTTGAKATAPAAQTKTPAAQTTPK